MPKEINLPGRVHCRVTAKTEEKLRRFARERNQTHSQVVRDILEGVTSETLDEIAIPLRPAERG